MLMIDFLAHAKQFHDATTTETEHILFTPLVYGAVNFLTVIIVLGVLQLVKASLGTKLLTAMALLLVGGVLGYQYVPAVGGIMIALGIALALGTTLLSVAGSSSTDS